MDMIIFIPGMKKVYFLLVILFICPSHAYTMNFIEWLDSIAQTSVLRHGSLVLFERPQGVPLRIHQLERVEPDTALSDGEYVYSFGEYSEAVSVETVDPLTGLPYMLLVSANLPRKILAAQLLVMGADGQLLVVRENLTMTPRLFSATVHDLDPGTLSNQSFKMYDGREIRTTRDLGNPSVFAPVSDENNRYLSPPGTNGFQAQMAYYHLSHVRDRLESLGIEVPSGKTAPVFVNVAGLTHGVYQRRAPYLLAFGKREAADADLLCHEYGHAIVDRLNAPLMLEGESQFAAAVHEAFGDFLAYAMNGNASIGEWGSDRPRMINGHLHYPEDCIDLKLGRFEPHLASRIVSGAFFETAQIIGRLSALKLFAETISHLPPAPTFFDVRVAAIEAAGTRRSLVDALARIFAARGIDEEARDNDSAVFSGDKIELHDGRGRESDLFENRGQIEVIVEGQIRFSHSGYNLLSDLELSGPPGYEHTVVLLNGHWPAVDGQTVAPLGRLLLRDAPPGAYQLRARVKVGGNNRTSYFYRNFTIR